MLTKLIKSLQNNKIIYWLNKILCSPFYVGFVAVLVTLAEIFSFEILTYYILIFTSIVIPALLCNDMTPLVPSAVMMHIAMSKKTFDEENTIIMGSKIYHFIIMFSFIILFMAGRLVFDLITNKDRRKRFPRFLIGYGALFLAYILGGAFSKYYEFNTFLFGIREFASIAGFYFYFFYAIDWKKFNKEYFAYVFMLFGIAISVEVLVLASIGNEFTTGWGIRNDIGGSIAMTIGGAGYLAVKKKAYINWIFVAVIFFLLTCTALTESRGGTASSLLMAVTCLILVLVLTNWVKRLTASLLLVGYITTMVLLFVFQRDLMMEKFGRIIDINLDDLDKYSSGRITIWKIGIEQWKTNPVFGVGWLQTTFAEFKFPPRYHNTYVQLLASTGLLGLIAYAFHRFETLFVTFKKPTLEKVFILICILGLMIANLVDCHFFNIWLGFSYGFLVANLEGHEIQKERIQ